jgi:hypothetical protein
MAVAEYHVWVRRDPDEPWRYFGLRIVDVVGSTATFGANFPKVDTALTGQIQDCSPDEPKLGAPNLCVQLSPGSQ